MREYPDSYHPVKTCHSCEHSKGIDNMKIEECTKHDVVVTPWCICDEYIPELPGAWTNA